MDAETIKLLASLPLEAILIYLIVRQQAQIEKLLGTICEVQAQHAKDLLSIALHAGKEKPIEENL